MEKNVLVVDEFGNNYGATYPKRAKGLVKKGRARFIDENTICLACPPDIKNLEDITMTEDKTIIIQQNENAQQDDIPQADTQPNAPELTVEYVLEQLKAIQDNDAYIYLTINELKQATSTGPGDTLAKCIGMVGEVVKHREETNRKLIDSYMKMYESLTAEDNFKSRFLDIIATAAKNPAGGDYDKLYTLLYTVRDM